MRSVCPLRALKCYKIASNRIGGDKRLLDKALGLSFNSECNAP